MLSELLEQQKHSINAFFTGLDLKKAEELFEKLSSSSGTLFFSGVGKSGLVAQKIASTLVSTGTRALYLSPMDALHGDIGLVSSGDAFILLSRSGETEELLKLLSFVKLRGAFTAALVCNPKSRLSRQVDCPLHLPLERELCPFDLTPTTSASIQLLFGDMLTVALMRKKAFRLEQYASNHPAGSIGLKTQLVVRDIMVKGDELPLVRSEGRLQDLLEEFSNKKQGCLLVVNEQLELASIFTDGDLRRALQKYGPDALQMTMKELGVQTLRTTKPSDLAFEALKEMEKDPKKPITMMPVLEGKKVVGLIRLHDIVQNGI